MTEPIPEELNEVVEISGRGFQAYSVQRHIYCVPIDGDEEERLIDQHHMLYHLFRERLYFPPIPYPRRVLDCGYGRGSWALTMAQHYAEAQVDAIDVYPAGVADDEDQPDNLELYWGDLNERLATALERNDYDLIHSRHVAPGISSGRWPSYIGDLIRLLRRGGWVQLTEYNYILQSDVGLLSDQHALHEWGVLYREVMQQDRDPRAGRSLRWWLDRPGVEDVCEQVFHVPIGKWSKDPQQDHIGEQMRVNVGAMLDALSLWPFTQRLGWSAAQVQDLTDRAREELQDARLKLYIPLHVVWGKKL